MPLYDALAFVKMELEARELNKDIKVIAAGKIITGFDILKVLALGASAVYSARGMMLSLGCIQALICDTGKCPVGVATQNPKLYKALDPTDKKVRVANYHANTIKATLEIMEACGMKNIQDVSAAKFFRKINEQEFRSFEEIYFKAGKSLKNNPFQTNLN
jgi:glutamate synthase domain-containing protein 2